MKASKDKPYCEGAASFDPDEFFDSWTAESLPRGNDFRGAITAAFKLRPDDDYVYRAEAAAVTLAQVQHAIGFGGRNGLHAWYVDDDGNEVRGICLPLLLS